MKMKIKISLLLGLRRFKRLKKETVSVREAVSPLHKRIEFLRGEALEQELFGSCIILKNM